MEGEPTITSKRKGKKTTLKPVWATTKGESTAPKMDSRQEKKRDRTKKGIFFAYREKKEIGKKGLTLASDAGKKRGDDALMKASLPKKKNALAEKIGNKEGAGGEQGKKSYGRVPGAK